MDELNIEIYERDTLGDLTNILLKNGYTEISIKKELEQTKSCHGVTYNKNFYKVVAKEQEDEWS